MKLSIKKEGLKLTKKLECRNKSKINFRTGFPIN